MEQETSLKRATVPTDGTLFARTYLQQTSLKLSEDPEERRRMLGVLTERIRKAVNDIFVFSVSGHWMLRVRGPSQALDHLEKFVQQTPGLEFARDNPSTGNTYEGTPESADPTEHR